MVKNVKTHSLTTRQAPKDRARERDIDEFLTQSRGIVAWAERNIRPILITLIVLVVVSVTVTLVTTYLQHREEKLSTKYIQAQEISDAVVVAEGQPKPEEETTPSGVPTYFSSEQEKEQALASAMEEVVQVDPGSGVAGMARIYEALALYRLGSYDEAIAALDKVLRDKTLSHYFRYSALETIGYSYEAQKKYQQALEYFQKLAEVDFYREYGLYHQGRMKVFLGDKDGARKLFRQVVDEFPSSPLKGKAEQRLSSLDYAG